MLRHELSGSLVIIHVVQWIRHGAQSILLITRLLETKETSSLLKKSSTLTPSVDVLRESRNLLYSLLISHAEFTVLAIPLRVYGSDLKPFAQVPSLRTTKKL